MTDEQWLKRKYPETHNEIIPLIKTGDRYVRKYKVGRLLGDITSCETYTKGTIFLYRKSNPVNYYNHPEIHCLFKNIDPNLTGSGFHSFTIFPVEFETVTK